MDKASLLPYYPRFIFKFGENDCFSTADLDMFKFIKEVIDGKEYDVTRFIIGQIINVTVANKDGSTEVKKYRVKKVEIQQIKDDLDAPTYGINLEDCPTIFGKEKKWLMEIYIFLDPVK